MNRQFHRLTCSRCLRVVLEERQRGAFRPVGAATWYFPDTGKLRVHCHCGMVNDFLPAPPDVEANKSDALTAMRTV